MPGIADSTQQAAIFFRADKRKDLRPAFFWPRGFSAQKKLALGSAIWIATRQRGKAARLIIAHESALPKERTLWIATAVSDEKEPGLFSLTIRGRTLRYQRALPSIAHRSSAVVLPLKPGPVFLWSTQES